MKPITTLAEPLCRVVRFGATDGIELSGLLYEPAKRADRIAIFLHGTGGASVFEARRTNLLARAFVDAGTAFFPFNNRGAHLMKRLRWTEAQVRAAARREKKPPNAQGGMAFERIRDCVADIDGAVKEARRRGYRQLMLIGHSTGANKIAVYDHHRRANGVQRYVLLAGGDDTGLLYEQLGPRRFASALSRAREAIRSGKGDDFVSKSISQLPMSWRSFYDMANPDGDYNVFPFLERMRGVRLSRKARFRYVRAIRKPSLYLYGENDEYCFGDVSRCLAILSEAIGSNPRAEIAMMAGADHGFSGQEAELADVILRWWES